jgi:hypothetical protein
MPGAAAVLESDHAGFMREISTHVDIQAGASLVSLADGRVRFHQSERFRGMAVPFSGPACGGT